MSEKKVKWCNAWSILLIGTVICIVLVATGASANAAEPESAAASVSSRPVTILDPFTLSTLTIAGAQASTNPAGAGSVVFVRPPSRKPVRVPPRPPMRSPFRPGW